LADHTPSDESIPGWWAIWRWFAQDLSSRNTLWHSLGLDLTVSKGVENPGHLAGFIPNEHLHPTVFPVEERVVPAGKKFDGFLSPGLGELGESIALANHGSFAFVAILAEAIVADIIIQVVVWGRLSIPVRYIGFVISHHLHVSAWGQVDAEQKYKLAHPKQTGRIEAKRVRGNPPGTGYDVDELLKDMIRAKLATEQITNRQRNNDS
jgi:hypothetical protein